MTLRRDANISPCTPQEAPAPTVRAESAPPEEEPEAWFAREDLLGFVREEATLIDPVHSHIYRAASPRRIRDAGWTAHDFMAVHAELHRRTGRGARSGKRQHAADVRRLLNSANDADLVLAQALLLVAIGTLPPDAPRRDD